MDWSQFWTYLAQAVIALFCLSVPLSLIAGLVASSIKSAREPRDTVRHVSQVYPMREEVRHVDLTPPK